MRQTVLVPEIAVITAAYRPTREHLLSAYASLVAQEVDWVWRLQIDGERIELPACITDDERVDVGYNDYRMGAAISRINALSRLENESFVQNLDVDDYLLPEAITTLRESLLVSPECAFAFGRALKTLPDGEVIKAEHDFSPGVFPPGDMVDRWRERRAPPMHPAGILWRREPLLIYGGWAALWSGQDTAIVMATSVHHSCVFVDLDTFVYRWHGDSQLSRSLQAKQMSGAKFRFIELRCEELRKGQPSWLPSGTSTRTDRDESVTDVAALTTEP